MAEQKKLDVVIPIHGDEDFIVPMSAQHIRFKVDPYQDITTTPRVLSADEMQYLLFGRSASTVLLVPNARFAKVAVTPVGSSDITTVGLLIFPDEFELPSGYPISPTSINSPTSPYTENTLNDRILQNLAALGCAFLPACGFRKEQTAYGYDGAAEDRILYYWTSGLESGETFPPEALALEVTDGSVQVRRLKVSYGCAVRLIDPTGTTFSVAVDRTVDIYEGNYQYKPIFGAVRTGTMLNVCGANNSRVSSQYTDWVDLFGYGTSGWDSGAVCYQQWSISREMDDYTQATLMGGNVRADWGVWQLWRQSELWVDSFFEYIGTTITVNDQTLYKIRQVVESGVAAELYVATQSLARGTKVYSYQGVLIGQISTDIVLSDFLTEENTIYAYAGVYYRRYGADLVQVTDVEFPSIEKPMELFDFTYEATRQGTAPTITATKMWYDWIDEEWTQEVHVHFNGEKYYVEINPTSTKANTDARYKYDLTFKSERKALEHTYCYDTALPYDITTELTENTVFSFYGDIEVFRKKVNASLIQVGLASYVLRTDENGFPLVPDPLTRAEWNALDEDDPLRQQYTTYQAYLQYCYVYEDGEFKIDGYQVVIGYDEYGDRQTSEEKLVEISNNTIHEVLQKVDEVYGLQYYVQSGTKNIVIGYCEHDFGEDNPIAYGVDNELLSVSKSNATEKICTRITGVGSSDNIPYYYPNPTPDGWIKPIYKRNSSELDDMVVYDPDSEKYLRNRVGYEFVFGRLRGTIKFGLDNTIDINNVLVVTENEDGTISARPRTRSDISYTTPLTTEEQRDVEFEVKLNLIDDMQVFFTDISCSIPYSKIFKVEVFKGQFQYDSQGIITNAVYPNRNNPTNVYTDGVSFINEDRFLESAPYKIIYHIDMLANDAPNAVALPSDPQTPTPFYIAYISNEEPVNITVGHNSYTFYCPMLFANCAGMKSRWNSSTSRWEWFHENFNSEAEYAAYMESHGGWGSINLYIASASLTYFLAHPAVYIDGRLHADVQSYEYHLIGSGNGLKLTEPLGSYELEDFIRYERQGGFFTGTLVATQYAGYEKSMVENNITLAKVYNHFMNGLIDYYDNHWHTSIDSAVNSDKIDDELLNFYGLSVDHENDTMFDKISFRSIRRVHYQPNLMPEVYIKTDGERRFYVAHNYDPVVEGVADEPIGEEVVTNRPVVVDGETIYQTGVVNDLYHNTVDDTPSYHYVFETEFDQKVPLDHIENFDDIKPTIKEMRTYVAVSLTQTDFNKEKTFYYTKSGNTYVQCSASSVFDSQTQYYAHLRVDVAEDFAFDRYDDNSVWEEQNEYKHGYFFVKLRPLGFNLFECALQDDMVISMTTGKCGACNFKIGVTDEKLKNPVQIYEQDAYVFQNNQYVLFAHKGDLRRYGDGHAYQDENGYMHTEYYILNEETGQFERVERYNETVTVGGRQIENQELGSLSNRTERLFGDVITCGHIIESQQDTTDNYVWIALQKDSETMGRLMPSAQDVYNDATPAVYERPVSVNYVHTEISTPSEDEENADKFVILNIRMPQAVYRAAERKLAEELVKYLYEHNYQQFNFSIDFSRIYLAQNDDFREMLNENSVVHILYNRLLPYRQFCQHYIYKMQSNQALPEIKVDMNQKMTVTKSLAKKLREGVQGDTPVTPPPITPPPLRPRPWERGDWMIDNIRDRISVVTPISDPGTGDNRNSIGRTGIQYFDGDIISRRTGISINDTIRRAVGNSESISELSDVAQRHESNLVDVGSYLATNALLTANNGEPWPSLRFRQMFPDDYMIPQSVLDAAALAGLTVATNSDGSFHIFGTITNNYILNVVADVDDFIADYVPDSAAAADDVFAICFLSSADSSVFEPRELQATTETDWEDTYTRYITLMKLPIACSSFGITIKAIAADTETYVDFSVKIRMYDMTSMFGQTSGGGACALTALRSHDVFCQDYLSGDTLNVSGYRSIGEPFADYPYTDDYIILHQRAYIERSAASKVRADYTTLFPVASGLDLTLCGWACIVDAMDDRTAEYHFDSSLGDGLIIRRIAKIDLGQQFWEDTMYNNVRGKRAELLNAFYVKTKTVLCPIAPHEAIALNGYLVTLFVDNDKSYIFVSENALQRYDLTEYETTDNGVIYYGLSGVWAEYILDQGYGEKVK